LAKKPRLDSILRSDLEEHSEDVFLEARVAAANALQQFKPDECANFFAHAGYSLE
jgi:hypothetical protein